MSLIQLQPDEKIVLSVRRHWYVVVAESLILFGLAILPFIILPAIGYLNFKFSSSFSSLYIFLSSLWLLGLWLTFFIFWTNYYLDVWIITNQKIIDIEQHGLFRREISEYRLDNIQDVTVKIPDLLATFFKFGNVEVQTAGATSQTFVIRNAPHPEEVRDLIIKMQNEVMPTASPNVPNPRTQTAPEARLSH